ncbi:MAG TPA: hypothetical protein VIL04_10235 [Solirubrobacterales bacterium]|jgi:O-antigen/teichoic acid export membrane protein
MTVSAGVETKKFGRSAGLLSTGIAASGVLTYVFFALASHNLSAHEYGEIAVLWSAVFVTISIFHRPVELLLSRTIAERRARREEIASALRVAGLIQLGVALGLAAIALALRGPLQDELLSGSETLYWVLVVSVVAFGGSFYARGYLAGNRHFGVLAALLFCESASRMAFALAVALGIASGQATIALGVAAAPLFSLAVMPFALARGARTGLAARAQTRPAAGVNPVTVASGGGFAAAVLIVMMGEQTFLNAGPLLARGFEDAAAAGFIFNVLMVARAPLLVFQGVAQSLLPHLTRLGARGKDAEAAFHHSVWVTIRAIAVFAALVLLVVLLAGPTLMQIAFGDRFEYDRLGLAIVAVGMGGYLAATTLNQAILARGGARVAARCWGLTAAAFLVWCLLPITGDIDLRIELGFAFGAALLAAQLALAYRAGTPGPPLAPDSPDEIEARLAGYDEVS